MSDAFQDFFDTLIDCGLLISRGEAVVLATVSRRRGQLDWMAVLDTCAVRAAHKKSSK